VNVTRTIGNLQRSSCRLEFGAKEWPYRVESDKRKTYNVQIRRAQTACSHAYRSLPGHGTAGIVAFAHLPPEFQG